MVVPTLSHVSDHGVAAGDALYPKTVSDCRVPQKCPARGHKLEIDLRTIARLCEQADATPQGGTQFSPCPTTARIKQNPRCCRTGINSADAVSCNRLLSHDTLFAGKLYCSQSLEGYRFSIDAVLLAHFSTPRRQDRVLDLGAGCGVVSLILAHRHPSIVLTCLEIQDSLSALISYNICQNGLADRMRLVTGDLRSANELLEVGAFDMVVCNPPYYGLGRGQQNPKDEQAVARHELKAGLPDIVKAAAFALRTKGRLVVVYPAARGAALLAALKQRQLEPKRLQAVYPHPGAEGTLLLVEAVKGGGEELTVLPPLYVYDRPGGDYSPEVAAFYR